MDGWITTFSDDHSTTCVVCGWTVTSIAYVCLSVNLFTDCETLSVFLVCWAFNNSS